jgi:hypothetical protein
MSKRTDYRLQYEITRRVEAETHAKLLEEALTKARQPPPPPPPAAPAPAPTPSLYEQANQIANPYMRAQFIHWHRDSIAAEQAQIRRAAK